MKIILLLATLSSVACELPGIVLQGSFEVTDKYPGGFTARIEFPARRDYRYGWMLNVTFDIDILDFKVSSVFHRATSPGFTRGIWPTPFTPEKGGKTIPFFVLLAN